jgi:TusA-related sulfurtransferase
MSRRIDALDVRSPAPFLKVEVAFHDLKIGETVTVQCDDPWFPSDCAMWCEKAGHELLSLKDNRGVHTAVIEKRR